MRHFVERFTEVQEKCIDFTAAPTAFTNASVVDLTVKKKFFFFVIFMDE